MTQAAPETDDASADDSSDDATDSKRTYTAAEVSATVRKRLAAERAKLGDVAEIKRKAEEYDKAQEASKTQAERDAARIKELETERDTLASKQLKTDIGAKFGLTPVQAKRLVGTTAEEIEADAEELANDLGIKRDDDRRKPGDARPKPRDGGNSGRQNAETDPDADANEWMRNRAARR